MGHAAHFRNDCVCGNVLNQCRCPGPKLINVRKTCTCDEPKNPRPRDEHDDMDDARLLLHLNGLIDPCPLVDSNGVPFGQINALKTAAKLQEYEQLVAELSAQLGLPEDS